jgi:Uma2 family endonuclease
MSVDARAITLDLDAVHLVVPREAWTLAGFRRWTKSEDFPERVRASWIEGEVLLDMSPEPIDTHNSVKTEITAVLHAIARDEQLGEVYSDGVLYTHEEAGVSTEPDVVYVSFESIERSQVRFEPKANRPDDRLELQGSPDLVVEVVSDSSQRKDETLLRTAYARASVPEYWLVDARGETLRFVILSLQGEEYEPAARSRVLDRVFRLDRTLNRVGRWSYRLHVVPE